MNLPDTIPTDSLMRFLEATPEQRAAFDRFQLSASRGNRGGDRQGGESDACGAAARFLETLMRIEKKLDALQAAMAGTQPRPDIQLGEREAGRVFLLMQRLESRPTQRKASLGTVFRLLVLEGLSQRAAAARCGCVKSLISARVVAIERAFGMSLERLRSFASALLSLEAAAIGERTRKKKFGGPELMQKDDNDEEHCFADEYQHQEP